MYRSRIIFARLIFTKLISAMTFSETVLANHFVILGFKQARTRLLVLRQKAAASDNCLSSTRHLLHVHPRSVRSEFGKVCLFGICGSHSTALVSPHTHSLGSLFTFLPPRELLLPHRPAKSLPFLAGKTTEIHSISAVLLPSLSKLEKIKCDLLPACLSRGLP